MLKQGKGLMEQINEVNKRQYVAYTGIDGMNDIMHAFEVIGAISTLNNIKKISDIDYNRLKEMINSPDRENLVVANAIMDNYGLTR